MLLLHSRIMSTTSWKHATSTYGVCATFVAPYLVTLHDDWIVGTRLHNYNALLHGATEKLLNNLWSPEQACPSRLHRNHMAAAHRRSLCNLHWLPIRSRIMFKVAILYFKAYRCNQLSNLLVTLEPYVPCRGLKSAEMDLLTVSRSHTKILTCCFSSVTPTICNGFLLPIYNSKNIGIFKPKASEHLNRTSKCIYYVVIF